MTDLRHESVAAAMVALGARLGRVLPWAIWCLVLVPSAIVLHELGHLMAARALGFPDPVLHYSSISHGDISTVPSAEVGIVGLAGPLITALLTLFACGWIALRGPDHWAVALAVAAASRFAVGVPYTIANAVVSLTGGQLHPPAFDEHRAATALGWSGDLILALTAALFVATLLWIGRALPRDNRWAAWTGLVLGTALGWAVWMIGLGPVLLP